MYALEKRISTPRSASAASTTATSSAAARSKLYTYGPDADALFAVIQDSLRGFEVRPGSYAIKRYGSVEGPGVREERVELA